MITKSIEKNKEEKSLKQDDELLVASFFYDNFLEKMNVKSPMLTELISLAEELAKVTGDEVLLPIIQGTLVPEQKEAVLEAQLYRERQRDLHTDEKKEREVQAMCQKYIQRTMQHLSKLTRIPTEQKHALHERMRKVIMGK